MYISPKKRIFYNIIATYSRSLFTLLCGLLTGRWTLLTLGKVDLGLLGVVGGMTVFIGFINGLMSGAISRYFAYSVGECRKSPGLGLEKCQQWFNTALLIHTILPLILVIIGYPIGEYAVNHWLTIPQERITDCVWVFRISCITCFLSMICVPYYAMYNAKQLIAEITVYDIAFTIFHVCLLYYMLVHPGVWMLKYCCINALYGILPRICIVLRALVSFPECKLIPKYLWNIERIKHIINFSGWQFFGSLGSILRAQGIAILVNNFFGPSINASNTIANNLAGHSITLSTSLSGAFAPAISSACGAKNYTEMRKMAFFTCKAGVLLILIFALPMMLEVDQLLILWLKEPPEYVGFLCVCVMIRLILDRISYGHMLAVNAMGKIALYQSVLGTTLILTLPIAWLLIELDFGVYSIGYSMIFTMFLCSVGRVWFARKLTGMSAMYWLKTIAIPIIVIVVLGLAGGMISILWISSGLWRIIITTVCVNVIVVTLSWLFLLTQDEKIYFRDKIKMILGNRK